MTPTNTTIKAQPLDLDKPILTQAAFEEIATSWDGCEGEGIKDIGAALRQDFDRLASHQAHQVGSLDERLITQEWMDYCTILRQAGKEPTDAQGDAFEFAWNAALIAQARTAKPASAKLSMDEHTTSYHQGYQAGIAMGKALAADEGAADTTASASIDTPEFRRLVAHYQFTGSTEKSLRAMIAYIDSRASLTPVSAQQNDIEMVKGALDLCEPEEQQAFQRIIAALKGQNHG
jgi:hypothetical protein